MSDIISPFPFSLVNGQKADATQVMADLNQIRNDVNVQVPEIVAAAGSYLKTQVLTISADATTFTLPANCTIVSTIATQSSGVFLNPTYSGDSVNLFITNDYNDNVITGTAIPTNIIETNIGAVRSNWNTNFLVANIPTTCSLRIFDANLNDYIPWYTAVVKIVIFYCVL